MLSFMFKVTLIIVTLTFAVTEDGNYMIFIIVISAVTGAP